MATPKPVQFLIVGIALVAVLVGSRSGKRPASPRAISLPPVVQQPEIATGKARVVKIIDGDSLRALIPDAAGGAAIDGPVRLYGINAPELHAKPGMPNANFLVEPFAQESSDYLSQIAPPGSEISLRLHGRDRFERVLAVLILPDGRDANKLLIEAGMARVLFLSKQKNDPLRPEYERAQADAQQARRGMWK